MYNELVQKILDLHDTEFKTATEIIREWVDTIPEKAFRQVVAQIGTIPECIAHDSSEEKLYSKASDLVLARCFRLLGLAAKALDERGDSADIIAESQSGYNYSLVADAKCFRLSRTAKNQKDFKVSNLSDWRGSENEYAVLIAPYFQFPQNSSQIYSKALENNVCLLSWEHLYLLMLHEVKETNQLSLESLWNASLMISRDKRLSFSSAKNCFLPKMNAYIAKKIGCSNSEMQTMIDGCKKSIIERGSQEISFWKSKINDIQKLTRTQAINELIKALKLNEKIEMISKYIDRLSKGIYDEEN